MNRAAVTWIIGSIVGLFAIATGVRTYWPIVGWETPVAHAEDIGSVRVSVATTAQAATALEQRLAGEIKGAADRLEQQIKEGQDEYRCDKLDAELRELRRVLRANPDDVDAAEDIRRISERMGPDGLNCARFDV